MKFFQYFTHTAMHKYPYVFLMFAMCCAGIPGNAQQTTTIMTWNTRLDVASDGPNAWSNRRQQFTELLLQEHPELLGMQEVLHNQLLDIAATLSGYGYIGVGRTDGKTKGEYGPVFYDTSRFKLIDAGYYWLSQTPEVAGSKGWDAACERIMSWAKLESRQTGKFLWVLNTHLDHMGTEARRNSLALIKELTTKMIGDEPFVLMGDFNFEPTDENYTTVSNWLTDARTAAATDELKQQITFTGFDEQEENNSLIDFIFVNHKITITDYQIPEANIDGRFSSDHLPVKVQMMW